MEAMSQDPVVYDVTIVGGGIIGLSTIMTLATRFPGRKFLLLEKESKLALHQTGHNSGVIHSGIYYQPGSLKAKMCVEGAKALVTFCQHHAIPYEICGKVIVATHPSELPRLETLYARGNTNGIQGLQLIRPERLREMEPYATGLRAIYVPSTGIVDFGKVARTYAKVALEKGAEIYTSARAQRFFHDQSQWRIETAAGDFRSRILINCGGLHADRIARLTQSTPKVAIIPFRGEYYEIVPERAHLVKNLIYPVPNPLFPFLGVHLTRMISGKVKAGPNAVLALKREGYNKRDVDLKDMWNMLGYAGFWRMVRKYGRIGLEEWVQSFWKREFVRAAQRLLPDLTSEDLVPSMTGVRAQAVNGDGSLLDDFSIVRDRNAIHVLNVPSPAATASLRIGEVIAETAEEIF